MRSLYKRKTASKRYPEGPVWYAKVCKNGKPNRVSLKTDFIRRARTKLVEIEATEQANRGSAPYKGSEHEET